MFKRENVFIFLLWAFILTMFFGIGKLGWAAPEGDTGPNAVRVITTDGTHRNPWALLVGSDAASSPYGFDVTYSSITGNTLDQLRADRCTAIVNPSSNFVLMLGTYSTFGYSDIWFPINKSSGTYTDCAHERFWLRYPPGSSSETVRGMQLKSGE